MKRILLTAAILSGLFHGVQAQSADTNTLSKLFNVGIGASSWGVPFYAGFESPLEMENATIAFGFSYQSRDETQELWWYLDDVTWRHTIIGIDGSWRYYVDEILGLPDNLDLYGGVGFGYWIWRTRIKTAYDGFDEAYSGTGSGGLGASYILGGRYFFKDKLALNAQFGGGTILSAGKIGLSFTL